jgi:hypothetical protein
MRLVISLLFLAALVGVIVLINARGWLRQAGCTCRRGEACDRHDTHP